ncbi:hypothetical protein QC761_0052430 [Podospora bellae-mahoneyi]|uniref:MARVEL domain-containing protein n=1 Tax=Podospora bellae-mahoneyi TaxID=2093777 RepID=A0ABR0FLS4_9PEZI|nr:hypothetical protein QC761_0052430 [Podospora bellae-mahoneyi]
MTPERFNIPRAFNWILPAQVLLAAVAIYSSTYVFNLATITTILTIIATSIHLLLALSLCLIHSIPTRNTHQIFITPILLLLLLLLLLGTGLWAASLCYHAKQVDLLLTYPLLSQTTTQPLTPTWSKIGLATTALNLFLDLALLLLTLSTIIDQNPSPPPPPLPTTISYPQQQSHYTTHHQFTTPTSPIPPVPPIPSTYYSPAIPESRI